MNKNRNARATTNIEPRRKFRMPAVLVVDDEPVLRELIASYLVGEGYETITAKDGEDALCCLEENKFDAIITDLRMPKVDGLTLIQRVRATGSSIPVVVMTASWGIAASDLSLLNIRAFLMKPFYLTDLSDILCQIIKPASFVAMPADTLSQLSAHL